MLAADTCYARHRGMKQDPKLCQNASHGKWGQHCNAHIHGASTKLLLELNPTPSPGGWNPPRPNFLKIPHSSPTPPPGGWGLGGQVFWAERPGNAWVVREKRRLGWGPWAALA